MDLPHVVIPNTRTNASTRKRVLVTGGAGFIGSHLVGRLMLMGDEVRVVDTFCTGRLENLADAMYGGLRESDVLNHDIRTPEGVEVIHEWQPDVVVHLAAQTGTPVAGRSPLYDTDVNVFGTVNVLEACRRSGVGLVVHAASSAIYGRVPAGALPATEDHPMAPVSSYGIGKAAAVGYLAWYERQYGLPQTSLVCGNVYGPRQSGQDGGVVSVMTEAMLDGHPVTIHGDGNQTRDFVYVGDVAEAIALACHRGGLGLVNIASGRQTSVNEVYQTVHWAAGGECDLQYDPSTGPGAVQRMALDITRARTMLGWQPAVNFAEGVRMTVRDARRRRAGSVSMRSLQDVGPVTSVY